MKTKNIIALVILVIAFIALPIAGILFSRAFNLTFDEAFFIIFAGTALESGIGIAIVYIATKDIK
jgi:hypothetical protein